MTEKILIYDCETSTNGKPDPASDKLKLFGCYSYITKKFYYLTKKEDIKKIVDAHDFLVGFNNFQYDNAVLCKFLDDGVKGNNYGDYKFNYKTNIDLMDVFKSRAGVIKIDKGMLGDLLMSYSLDFISKTIGIVDENDGKIKTFNYNVLNKESWSVEEKKYIVEYLRRDLEVTKKMFDWLEEYFKEWKELVTFADAKNKNYLTCTPAVFAYKVVCKFAKIEEAYDSNATREESFGGGYVAHPAGESFEGNIFLFDFSSLYPNLFIMGNLFANNCDCCLQDEKWIGDGFFKIKGGTCKKKLHLLSETLKNIYLKRVEFKKNKDNREYSYKIVINSLYGAISNPVFKNIYNLESAENCTSLGRQFILYARKRFREEGYKNLMSDTDSIAVLCPERKTKEDAQILADKITKELLSHMPFPW